MTVKELKRILDKLDDNMSVYCDDIDIGFYEYAIADCEVRQDLQTGTEFLYIGDSKQF